MDTGRPESTLLAMRQDLDKICFFQQRLEERLLASAWAAGGRDALDSDVHQLEHRVRAVRIQISKRLKTFDDHDEQGETPLHLAVAAGDEEAVRRVLPVSKIDATDAKGFTALHTAVRLENESIAHLLISSGAKISTCATDGSSPLSEAVATDSRSVANVLFIGISDQLVDRPFTIQGQVTEVLISKKKPIHSSAFLTSLRDFLF
jgi:hypothetical protein